MKRHIGLMIACMALILASSTQVSASGNQVAARVVLPWELTEVDHSSNFRSLSLGTDPDGFVPQLYYYDTVNVQLKEALTVLPGTGNCGAGSSWMCDFTSFGLNRGLYNDVANIYLSGNQEIRRGVVYYDGVSNLLKYNYQYRGPGGPLVGQYTVLDFKHWSGGTIGSQPSMVFESGGYPHIAVVVNSTTTQYLFWAHYTGNAGGSCASLGGSEYWDCTQILAGVNVAADPSIMTQKSGAPLIAYYDPSISALKITYYYPYPPYANCGPSNDWRCVTIDNTADTGRFPSIAFDDAQYIAYYNRTSGTLMAAKWVNTGGNCGNDWTGSGYANRGSATQSNRWGLG